jgi:hypothetical protein
VKQNESFHVCLLLAPSPFFAKISPQNFLLVKRVFQQKQLSGAMLN